MTLRRFGPPHLLILAFGLRALSAVGSAAGEGAGRFTRLPAVTATQSGRVPAGAAEVGRLVLANEPDGAEAGAALEFDLEPFAHGATPLARIQVGEVEKLRVSRPGQSPGVERGVMHALVRGPDGELAVAGTMPMKPGGNVNTYLLDVTDAANVALARPRGRRKLRVEIRIAGKPLPYEVYALPAAKPVLELASPAGWVDDWERRLAPITRGPVVYREACLPLAERRDREVVLPLLFPAKKITEVIANATGESLQPGRDWILRDGRLVLPPGTRAPVQIEAEFFQAPRKEKDGTVKMVPSQIRLTEGTFYHERQIEVTYEPAARDWAWPAPISSPAALPRFHQRLAAGTPLTVILFGDSISVSYNASRHTGAWPYQPGFGELVMRRLAQSGARISFLNHSRGGETSLHATTQADAQVAWFKPDLVIIALGMNDRSPERRPALRENLEKIIDTVRARSPETEFVIVTPMLNNPKQPTGLEPVKFIRDEALRIARPGVAFVDLTTTQLELLKRKSYLDLSGNGANHPNDFLIRLYAQRILEVLAPP